ncbi:hypothetical protein V8G54_012169 [Vigna mungo]|uniref:Uncharacterized protein n=1 Tax=Vigna mungo TaxID=3915 RepID=A0AAQ3NU80_VIGMU
MENEHVFRCSQQAKEKKILSFIHPTPFTENLLQRKLPCQKRSSSQECFPKKVAAAALLRGQELLGHRLSFSSTGMFSRNSWATDGHSRLLGCSPGTPGPRTELLGHGRSFSSTGCSPGTPGPHIIILVYLDVLQELLGHGRPFTFTRRFSRNSWATDDQSCLLEILQELQGHGQPFIPTGSAFCRYLSLSTRKVIERSKFKDHRTTRISDDRAPQEERRQAENPVQASETDKARQSGFPAEDKNSRKLNVISGVIECDTRGRKNPPQIDCGDSNCGGWNWLEGCESHSAQAFPSGKFAQRTLCEFLLAPRVVRYANFFCQALHPGAPCDPVDKVVVGVNVTSIVDGCNSMILKGGYMVVPCVPYGVYPDILMIIHAQVESDEPCGENSRRVAVDGFPVTVPPGCTNPWNLTFHTSPHGQITWLVIGIRITHLVIEDEVTLEAALERDGGATT